MSHVLARRSVIASSLVFGAVGLLFACTVEDENPAAPSRRSGSDSGVEASTQGPGPQSGPVDGQFCASKGGYEKVRLLARAVVDGASADCRVGPMFKDVLADLSTAEHTKGCFEQFFSASLKCAGVSFTLGTSKGGNSICDTPLPNLAFSAKDWQAWGDFNANPPSVAVSILTANGLTPDDLRVIGPIFESIKTGLIDGDRDPNRFSQCEAVCASGGAACGEPPPPPPEDAGNDATTSPPPDGGDGG